MTPGLHLPLMAPGTVWLVGAGPGDPGLLTLHALNALKQADIVVHDALVGKNVLALVNPTAKLEYAGKRGGEPSTDQKEISDRLIALARAGHRVVRLKGGDPFVFGRGGEEALALAEAGISFAIVPGVTSGLAALSAAGISATTRETNSAIILATGHFALDGTQKADWAALAAMGHPIILYMAMHNLARISEQLLAGGLAPQTPLTVVANATTARQLVLESTLGQGVADIKAAGLKAPAIIAIGNIVSLRKQLASKLVSLVAELDCSERSSLVEVES